MNPSGGLIRSILAVIAGALALILFVVGGWYFIFRYVRPLFAGGFGTGMTVSFAGLVIVATLASTASGYLAARIAGRAPLIHAIAVPVVCSTLFYIRQRIAFGPNADYPLVFMVIAAALCALGGWFASLQTDAEIMANTEL